MMFFITLHTRYFSKFMNKLMLMSEQLNQDIKIEHPNFMNSSPKLIGTKKNIKEVSIKSYRDDSQIETQQAVNFNISTPNRENESPTNISDSMYIDDDTHKLNQLTNNRMDNKSHEMNTSSMIINSEEILNEDSNEENEELGTIENQQLSMEISKIIESPSENTNSFVSEDDPQRSPPDTISISRLKSIKIPTTPSGIDNISSSSQYNPLFINPSRPHEILQTKISGVIKNKRESRKKK